MNKLFHTFSIGENEQLKQIQVNAITAKQTLEFVYNAYTVFTKGGKPIDLIENTLLDGLKIDGKDATTEQLELFEYIDLLVEAVQTQIDFESLGKSKTLKAMGINIDMVKIKEKVSQKIIENSLNEVKES